MERRREYENILVLGAGNFGTCLAQHLAGLGYKPTLYTRSSSLVNSINKSHINSSYLSKFNLHSQIRAVSELTAEFMKEFSVIVVAVPTQSLRAVLFPLKHFLESKVIVCVSKGIEVQNLDLPSDILFSLIGEEAKKNAVYLSGPSFAVEVMENQPTAVTVASYNQSASRVVQSIFHSPHFRTYLCDDPVGLEVAGALKNVIAIAAGACVGLGFKSNSLAALITRGLAELTRIGVALGANSLTFKGLAGIGDLMLTCSSQKSRNFRIGYFLARGKSLHEAQKELGSVAEGVATTKAAFLLAEQLGVRTAIIKAVYRVLYEACDIQEALQELLTSSARSELE